MVDRNISLEQILKFSLLSNLLMIPATVLAAHSKHILAVCLAVWLIDFFMLIYVNTGIKKSIEQIHKYMIVKLLFDMTAIIMVATFEKSGKLVMIPWVVALFYNNFNISHLRSPFFKKCLYVFLVLSSLSPVFHSFNLMLLITNISIPIILLVVFQLQKNQVQHYEDRINHLDASNSQLQQDIEFRQQEHEKDIMELELLKEKNRSIEFSTILAVHDIGNSLFKLARIQIAAKRGEIPMIHAQRVTTVVDEIQNKLELISHPSSIQFCLIDEIYALIRRFPRVRFEINENSLNQQVETNRAFLLSILQNLVENAFEAGVRRELEKVVIAIHFNDNQELVVEDNAGGFDISKIALYNTEKQEPGRHGIFLQTLLTRGLEMGFKVVPERLDTGMRFTIGFVSVDNPNKTTARTRTIPTTTQSLTHEPAQQSSHTQFVLAKEPHES